MQLFHVYDASLAAAWSYAGGHLTLRVAKLQRRQCLCRAAWGDFDCQLPQTLKCKLVSLEQTQCGHLQGFPPANKYAQQITMKLASLYGLKSSVQGSGKQRFVVVSDLPALVRY